MDDICGLKSYLVLIHHKFFYWNPSMRKKGHFYNWFSNFMIKASFLWSKEYFPKKDLCIFSTTTFHHHFWSKNVNFRYIFHFEYVNEVWISSVLGVKNWNISWLILPLFDFGKLIFFSFWSSTNELWQNCLTGGVKK